MTNPVKVTLRDTILNDVLIHELECSSSLYDEPCDCIQQNVADRIITTVIRELEGRLPEPKEERQIGSVNLTTEKDRGYNQALADIQSILKEMGEHE
jgi:hypothetical protein